MVCLLNFMTETLPYIVICSTTPLIVRSYYIRWCNWLMKQWIFTRNINLPGFYDLFEHKHTKSFVLWERALPGDFLDPVDNGGLISGNGVSPRRGEEATMYTNQNPKARFARFRDLENLPPLREMYERNGGEAKRDLPQSPTGSSKMCTSLPYTWSLYA